MHSIIQSGRAKFSQDFQLRLLILSSVTEFKLQGHQTPVSKFIRVVSVTELPIQPESSKLSPNVQKNCSSVSDFKIQSESAGFSRNVHNSVKKVIWSMSSTLSQWVHSSFRQLTIISENLHCVQVKWFTIQCYQFSQWGKNTDCKFTVHSETLQFSQWVQN